jgi:RNA polymerase sigma-70 factor (ECF subfamily)
MEMGEPESRDAGADALMGLVYDELRQLAGSFLRRQAPGHTLQPTALVHEAYIRLAKRTSLDCESRAHFFNIAAQAMRQILVDHARRRRAAKRGGSGVKVTLDEGVARTETPDVDLLSLMEALEGLSKLNQRHSDIVTLRFFGGLTVEEVAQQLGVTTRTVELDWRMARSWLVSELKKEK